MSMQSKVEQPKETFDDVPRNSLYIFGALCCPLWVNHLIKAANPNINVYENNICTYSVLFCLKTDIIGCRYAIPKTSNKGGG